MRGKSIRKFQRESMFIYRSLGKTGMISESGYWKEDLLKQTESLDKLQRQSRLGNRSLSRLEKIVMIGFYSIRKLLDSKSISDNIADEKIIIETLPSKGASVTLMNYHRIFDLYDFNKRREEKKKLRFLCNKIIHSYIYFPTFEGKNKLWGVIFTCRDDKNKLLYVLPLQKIIDIFKKVGTNDPQSISMHFDPKRKDYDVKVGSNLEIPS